MIFPDFQFGEGIFVLVLGEVILEREASVPDAVVLKHDVNCHVAQSDESDLIFESGFGQAATLFLIQWTAGSGFVEISSTGENSGVLSCSIHRDGSEVISGFRSRYGGLGEALVFVSEPLSVVDAKADETLLLNWVEYVEASRLPIKFLAVLVFQDDVRSRVVTEADLSQVLQLHGLLESDLESFHFRKADESSRHHVEGRVV